MSDVPRCQLCSKQSKRLKLIRGICGRCRWATQRPSSSAACRRWRERRRAADPSWRPKRAAADRAYRERCRQRLLAGRVVWAAFDVYGQLLGVYSSERVAGRISGVVRSVKIDRVPAHKSKSVRLLSA